MYPVYIMKAETRNPDTLLAPSKVVNAAPIDRNKAVMHIDVANTTFAKYQ